MPAPTKEKIENFRRSGYITCKEAGELARVAPSTIAGWVEKGHVDHIKNGMYIFVLKKDIIKMLPEVPARKAKAATMRSSVNFSKQQLELNMAPNTNIITNSFAKEFLNALRDPLVRKEMQRVVKAGVTDFALQKDESVL